MRRPYSLPLVASITAVVLLLAACSGSSDESADTTLAPPTTTTAAPTTTAASTTTADAEAATAAAVSIHAIADGAVAVVGTATCAKETSTVCELDMSDPRLSGTEASDNYRLLIEDSEDAVAVVWVADELITNEEGIWRGITQGVVGQDSEPCGETYLVGEGAYEGLEFRGYFYPSTDGGQVWGWISTSE